ncbi:MAG: hypothetical protein WDN28_29300 [Chthoniobacter sp.]
MEKIEFVMLSAELQKRFNYDPVKAEAYREQSRANRAAAQQQMVQQQMAAIRARARGGGRKAERAAFARGSGPPVAHRAERDFRFGVD